MTLQNIEEIENWFQRNTGNTDIINEFETRITNSQAINVMIMTNYSVNNIHLLIKVMNVSYMFIISDDRNRVVEVLLNLSNVHYFPTIDFVLSEVNRVFFVSYEIVPDENIPKYLSSSMIIMN